MADYFPLISRAVSALDPNTPQRREAIYGRARDALEKQLRALQPPIPEADLARERAVLDETIRRVELQYVPSTIPATAPSPVERKTDDPVSIAAEKDAERAATVVEEAAAPSQGQSDEGVVPVRPKLSSGTTRGFLSDLKARTAVAVAVPVVVLIGVAAYLLRDDPAKYLAQESQTQSENAATGPQRKSEGRLDGTGGSAPVTGPRPTPPQAQQQADGKTPLPVASRVLFFEETADNPQGAQSDGIVVWRQENVSGGTGQPLTSAVRGSVTITRANMSLDIILKKNADRALPASHTVEVIFKPEAGRDGVKELGPIELREQENVPGFALQGAMVPVAVNLFLIGLDSADLVVTKNVTALQQGKWLAFQFRLTSGRLGAMLVEKGATGDKVIRDALEQWR